MKAYMQPQDINMNTQTTTTPSSPEKQGVPARKQSYSSHQNPSSVSPTKKTRTEFTSSIREGLEKTAAAIEKREKAPGLFQYFRKSTDEERREYFARMNEEMETQLEREF